MTDTATLAVRLEKLICANLTAGRHRALPWSVDCTRPDSANAVVAARVLAQASSLASLAAGVVSAAGALPAVESPPPSALPRVLLGEADPLHRQVLARLLERLGCAVDSAGTAAEAVAAFERRPYALVMLDSDGGEIRGLETAALLRRAEGGADRTPIIALTDHAGQDDRQQRQAAGIDDYIARPFLRENVKSVLSRFAPAGAAKAPETVWRYLTLDRRRLEELDEAAGVRGELLSGWIALFLSGAPQLLDRMRAAQEAGDAGAVSDRACQLRSRSGEIGALRVQEISGIVAALADSGSLAGVEPLLPELAIALERTAGELQAIGDEVRRGHRPARGCSPRKPARRNRTSPEGNPALLAVADPLVSRFLANSLAGAGFRVTQVSGGTEALRAMRETDFGVVILDLDVPEVDGYSVLSEIRMRPDPATPVMIVSARHQEQDILRAFELGADDYVTIPFSPLEVVARVRRLVKQGGHVR